MFSDFTTYSKSNIKILLLGVTMLLSLGCTDMLTESEAWDGVSEKVRPSADRIAGDTCAYGCIWSTFAVAMGAQAAESDCDGQACACVLDGDIWTQCDAESHMANNAQDNQSVRGTRGDSCGAGCIWSTFAVAIEAQPASADCDGQACACVVEGDVFTACHGQSQVAHAGQESNPPPRQNGEVCGEGCIWSTFAVTIEAQAAEDDCNGQACACVVDGDIWTKCGETPPSSASDSAYDTDEPVDHGNPSAEAATPEPQGGYNTQMGAQLADIAYGIGMRRNTVGYCYSAVADAIESITGPFLWGSSAYMAADQLQNSSWFSEASIGDLRQLPAGAVVVWGRGTSPHGHISIALGDGREASDHVTSQMLYHYGGAPARVFYPQ